MKHNPNDYQNYQSGFTHGYRIAQKLLAIKADATQSQVEAHIKNLAKFKTYFSQLNNYCETRGPSGMEGFMSILDNKNEALSLIARDQFIGDLKIAFNPIDNDLESYFVGKLDKISSFYEIPKFPTKVNGESVEFEYKTDENNTASEIKADYFKIERIITNSKDNFESDDLEGIVKLEKALYARMEIVAKQNGLDLNEASISVIAGDKEVKSLYEDLADEIHKIHEFILQDLDTIQELSDYLINDLNQMIKQYEDYSDKTFGESSEPSLSDLPPQSNNGSHTSKKPTTSFQEKYAALMKNKKSYKTYSINRKSISRIVDRAIAQLGNTND